MTEKFITTAAILMLVCSFSPETAAIPPAGSAFPASGGGMDLVDPLITYIIDPVFGMPTFWLAGGGDDPVIIIDTRGAGYDKDGGNGFSWSASLEKSRGAIPVSRELPIESVEYYAPYFILHPFVSPDIPVDLYDLVVSVEIGGKVYSDFQPHAVKVIDELKNEFSFLTVADIHVDDPRGYIYNWDETWGYQVINKMIAMINLLDPEFVIGLGDFAFGDSYTIEYPDVYNLLLKLDVPFFMGVGNHDAINHNWWLAQEKVDGLHAFEDLFAPAIYSFRYSDMEFINLNSMDWSEYDRRGVGVLNVHWEGQMREPQLDWFEEQLAASDSPFLVAGYHHPPQTSFEGEGADRVMSLVQDYLVDAVLLGHTHVDGVTDEGECKYITTASVMFDGFGGYPCLRKLDVYDGELVSWNYEDPKWSVPLYKDSGNEGDPLHSLGTAAISSEFSPANDGTNTTVTAYIYNYLLFDYSDISIEFYMPDPGAGYTYEVAGGTVVDVVETGDGHVWYVATDIPADTITEVVISLSEL